MNLCDAMAGNLMILIVVLLNGILFIREKERGLAI